MATRVETTPSNPGLSVSEVSKSEFARLKTEGVDVKEVKQGYWNEYSSKDKVTNEGASPCLIIYAINKDTHKIISGHFPIVSEELINDFTREALSKGTQRYEEESPEGIATPTPSQVKRLTKTSTDDADYERYLEMKARIKEWVSESGKDSVEVYLFGQNRKLFGSDVQKSQRMVDQITEHNDVTAEFNRLGIPIFNVKDFRKPNEDRVDDTFYNGNGTLYLSDRM